MSLTQEAVSELFEYREGVLYWKKDVRPCTKKGDKVGWKDKDGYLNTSIKHKKYKNHRIIFLMFHGYLPPVIDHIDGDISNNRIENLRQATKAQNCHNSKLSKANTSGFKGVSWDRVKEKWKVQVMINGFVPAVRYFKDLELAGLVAQELRNKYHKEFAKHA